MDVLLFDGCAFWDGTFISPLRELIWQMKVCPYCAFKKETQVTPTSCGFIENSSSFSNIDHFFAFLSLFLPWPADILRCNRQLIICSLFVSLQSRHSRTDALRRHLPRQPLQRGSGCWQHTPLQPLHHHPRPAVRCSAVASSLQRCLWFHSAAQSSCVFICASEVCLWDAGWHWELSWSRKKRPCWRRKSSTAREYQVLGHIRKWSGCIFHCWLSVSKLKAFISQLHFRARPRSEDLGQT